MAHPVDIHVGKQLRSRRKRLGMSQEELGKSVGVTFQQIQKYERGTNRVGSSRLYQFSKVLGTSISYFFDEFSPDETAIGLAEDTATIEKSRLLDSRETLNLVQAYYKITDPAVRNKILSLVKSLGSEDSVT